jgi:hypothetical protein
MTQIVVGLMLTLSLIAGIARGANDFVVRGSDSTGSGWSAKLWIAFNGSSPTATRDCRRLSLKFANAGSVSVDDACGMPVTSGMYSIDTFGVENQTSASGDVVLPAQQCDYATQQDDIEDLLRRAPLDERLPVQVSPSVAPMCAQLRQLLICRSRALESSGCVDTGIGATVARMCDAIPAARLASLDCELCEPEPCDGTNPACRRGLVCIGGKCIIDPQYSICRNASTQVVSACPDRAKRQDLETVVLAAKVGAMTNVTDTACAALLVAHANRSACYARVYADAGCRLPQAGPLHSLCTSDGMAQRIAATGCSICTSLPTITFAPSGTNGPVAPVSSISLVPSDINAGCLRAPFLALALVVGAIGFK